MTKKKGRSRRVGGSVTKYKVQSGAIRWRYQLLVGYDPTVPGSGKYVGKGGLLTAAEAEKALQKARADHAAGRDLTATVPTVADYSATWLDGLDLAPATVAGYRRIFTRHVNPTIGRLRLDKVTTTHLARLYRELGQPDQSRTRAPEGLGTNTVHKVHVAVGAMLDAAKEDRLIVDNPARRKSVRAPRAKAIAREKDEMVTWSGTQLRAFLTWDRDDYDDDVAALWWLAAYTGMRRSELLALRWADVDLTGARVQVRRALDTATPGAVKSTKSGRARVVDIDPATIAVLRAWRKTRAALSLDLATADAYVFGTLDGSPRNPMSVSEMFTRRVSKARQVLDGLPALTLHGMRHTHASLLLEAGVSPKVVQERLGHSTITTTMDTYAHVTPTMQRAAADRFADAVGGGK